MKIVDRLVSQGISEIIFCIGYKAEKVVEFFGDGRNLGIDISYSVEKQLMGTGGAIRNAAHLINYEDVIVLNGDSFCYFDIDQLLQSQGSTESAATLALVRAEDSGRFGSVVLDEAKRIISFEEKTASNRFSGLINAGVYVLSRRLLMGIEPDTVVSLERDIFPRAINDGMYAVLLEDARFIDIGTPESFASANWFFDDN